MLKTLKDALGIYLSISGLLLASIIGKIDWLYKEYVQLTTYGPLQDKYQMVFGFPSWILGITFILMWFFILTLIYANKIRLKIEDGYKELANLRGVGVSLRNDGLVKFSSDNDFSVWKKNILDWDQAVQKELKKINISISVWFSRLDVLPSHPRVPYDQNITPEHLKFLREHDRRLDNLGRLIRDLWGIGEVNE